MDSIYTFRYQPNLKFTLESAPPSTFSSRMDLEQIAGIIISLLLSLDLDLESTRNRLEIRNCSGTLLDFDPILTPYLTKIQNSILSARLTDSTKITGLDNTLSRYLGLLAGPSSFMVITYSTIGMIEGILVGCKFFNIDYHRMIIRLVDRTSTSEKIDKI